MNVSTTSPYTSIPTPTFQTNPTQVQVQQGGSVINTTDRFTEDPVYARAINGVGTPTRALPRPTLSRVDDFLWRGKQPSNAEVAGMAQMGFRSVINLRTTGKIINSERAAAEGAGMNFLNIQVKNRNVPKTTNDVVKFLDFMQQPENQPAYLHCAHGKGRTGIFAACYRLSIPDASKLDANGNPRVWTLDEAIAEAKANGCGAKKQLNWIRDFDRQLKAGQIPGYPLKEPLAFGPGITEAEGFDINNKNRPLPVLSQRMPLEQAKEVTQQLYTNFFGRDADADHALKTYAPMIAAGRLGEVGTILKNAGEFKNRDPQPTNAQLVEGLSDPVRRVLERAGVVTADALPEPTPTMPSFHVQPGSMIPMSV